MRYVPELYFKSPAEMCELFRDFPSDANTLKIGERCHLDLEFGPPSSGVSRTPGSARRISRELCYEVCGSATANARRTTQS